MLRAIETIDGAFARAQAWERRMQQILAAVGP